MMNSEQSIHVTWPARRFYWARLDVSALPEHGLRRRPTFAQLSYLFETVLPLPVEKLQVTFAPIRDARSPAGSAYLACGIERDKLRTELPVGAVTLTPGDLHEVEALRAVGEVEPGVDPGVLNLLHGDFEPGAIRRLRTRSMVELVAAVLVVAALITIGLQRRGQALMADAATWRGVEAAIYEETLGPDSLHAAQPQPVQLTVELRRLRQTRLTDQSTDGSAPLGGRAGGGGGAGTGGGGDVIGVLADLLRLWPDTNALTQSLSITTGRITVRAAVPDAAQAQVLIEAIEPLPGWQLQQPAIRAGRDGLDLELNFAPAPRSTSAPSTVVSEDQP